MLRDERRKLGKCDDETFDFAEKAPTILVGFAGEVSQLYEKFRGIRG